MVILKYQPLLTTPRQSPLSSNSGRYIQGVLFLLSYVFLSLLSYIWDRETKPTKLSKEGKSVLLAIVKDSLSSKTSLSLPCPQFIRPVSWCSFRPCRRVPVVHRSDDFRLSVAPRQHHCTVQNMYCIIYEWPPPDLFGIF